MQNIAANIARQLAAQAEAVCRYYLSHGTRRGRYWHVGDVHNNPGQSLYVRLHGPADGPGAAGKWTDAATGQHGDLLDLIGLQQGHTHFADTLKEATSFLNAPRPESSPPSPRRKRPEIAARRLFRAARPLANTLGERYLGRRGITVAVPASAIRYHPRCFYRPDDKAPLEHWPALVAAVTDLDGRICGAHRTYLARDGFGKAPMEEPRRAMGNLYGNGVRFGRVEDTMVVAEGLETTLSLVMLLPRLPAVAALSTSHLVLVKFPPGLKRLYIAADNDGPGEIAAKRLQDRATHAGIACRRLLSELKDWNCDLCDLGHGAASGLYTQLEPQDRQRFGS